jgi:MFS transporter, Spinster family, sphingosine-1-phosphate transporter
MPTRSPSSTHLPEAPDQPAASSVSPARVSVALLLSLNLLNYMDRYVLAAVEPLVANEILRPNDPDAQFKMGALASAFLVSYTLSAPVFGWLGDRWKRWTIIGLGVLLFTVASGASGLSVMASAWFAALGLGGLSAYVVLFITRALVGVGEGAYGPVAPTILADLFPVERRGGVLAWFYMAIPVGSALGYVMGGLVAHWFSWPIAFFVLVPPGIVLGAICLFMREPARGASERGLIQTPATDGRSGNPRYRVLLTTPSYVLNVLAMTASTFAIGGVSFWMPRYIAVFRNAADLKTANLAFGLITVVAGIFATLAGGYLADRLRTRVRGAYLVVSGISMLIGFPLFLAVLYVPFPAAWIVMAAAIVCLFFCTGPSNTALANVAHPSMRAVAFALCIFSIHAFGDVISPPIIGLASDRSGGNMNVGFMIVSIMILVAGVLWLIGSRYLDRDTAQAATRVA